MLEGYVISPDGKKMLIFTKRKAVYRRSFKAEYFIYDIARRPSRSSLRARTSRWLPGRQTSRHMAFVKDKNIFVTDGEKEVQVTKDGKFNEIINGIPDWVYEEEFAFNRAFAWNAMEHPSDGSVSMRAM